MSATHSAAYTEAFLTGRGTHGTCPQDVNITDILVQNFHVSRDEITEIQTATSHTAPAIIEIKGLTTCTTTYPATTA
jgi:hypothetical protein